MAEPRPAFTLDDPSADSAPFSMVVWAAFVSLAGLAAGVVLAPPRWSCNDYAACGVSLLAFLPPAAPILVAGAAWLAVPAGGGRVLAVRRAMWMALIGGVTCAALAATAASRGWNAEPAAIAIGLAGPACMLGALHPESGISYGSAKKLAGAGWLRAGAVLGITGGTGLVAGNAAAFGLRTTGFSSAAWTSAAILAIAGMAIAVLALSVMQRLGAPTKPAGEVSRTAGRPRSLTPMLRHLFLADLTIVASAAGSAGALWRFSFEQTIQSLDADGATLAIAMGWVAGAALMLLLAPRFDEKVGRGALLSLPIVAAAAGPLFVASFIGSPSAAALGAASVAFGFAFSAGPARYALAYDLCPSQDRLRASFRLHGWRLLAGGAAFFAVSGLYHLHQGMLLVVLSALCVGAFAIYMPTLGGLGRQRP